ncbi:MAG: S-layer homology domain-containing protein [Clostridiales bacterium]|nr:S-layer homology domain-containing protein [Clostridiales bacterium]
MSAYAIPALQWAVGQKIINGNADGTLDPTGTATRAQVAQIFTNLLNK